MKKIFIVWLVSLMTAGLVFAGGQQEDGASSSEEPVTLFFWGGVPAESGPQQVVDRFNEEFAEKGIQAEYNRYVNDDPGNLKLDVSLMGGSDIDLFISYGYERYAKRSESGMALKLNEYIQRDSFDVTDMLGAAAEKKSNLAGEYYGLMSKTYNNGFFANKDMFDAAGIPIPTSWTWEEFVAVSEKLSHGEGLDRVYGVYMNTTWNQQAPLELLDAEMGADHYYRDKGTRVDLSDPRYEKVLRGFVDMMDQGIMPSQQEAVSQKISGTSLFIQEKLALVHGTWIIRDIKNLEKYPHDFVTAYVPFPSDAPAGSPYYMGGGPGDALQINRNTKHPEEAWEFVKWYLQDGIMEMAPFGRFPLYTKTDRNSLARSVLSGVEEHFDKESLVEGFLTPAEHYAVAYLSNNEVIKIIKEEFDQAFYGAKSPAQALRDAEERANGALSQ